MRLLTLILALSILIAVSGTAQAVTIGGATIPSGPVVLKFTNYDEVTKYTTQDGVFTDPTVIQSKATVFPVHAATGESQWGVFRLDTIENTAQTVTYYDKNSASQQITGIFWGGADDFLSQSTVGGQPTQNIHTNGVHIAFFQGAKTFDPTLGPTGRPTNGDPTYPGATNATPILTFNAVPGWDGSYPTDSFFTTFRDSTSGNGGFMAQAGSVPFYGTGSLNSSLDTNFIGNGIAAQFDFSLVQGTNGWMLQSNDPLLLSFLGSNPPPVVPEPITMLGVILGLGCVGRYIHRNKAVK